MDKEGVIPLSVTYVHTCLRIPWVGGTGTTLYGQLL